MPETMAMITMTTAWRPVLTRPPARRPARRAIRLAVTVFLLAAAGCGPATIRSETPMEPVAARLLALGQAYSQFTFERGQPPRGPADLRGRVEGDDAFVSPRDGEPLVIFWGVDLRSPPTWATGRPVLAHEKTGVEGRRHVLTTMRNVELLDDDAFRASSFPPAR